MATTDLEAHVGAAGRDKLVQEVRKKIDELGITYIYYQFISVTGRIVGKGIPADHWERTAEKGFQLVYGSTANLFIDRHGDYIGYGPESSELVGIPDPEDLRAASLGQAHRARLLHLLSQSRRRRKPRRPSDVRLPRQSRHSPRRVPGQAWHAAARWHRAGDDVADQGRGRQGHRRLLQALLLPHRSVREPAPGLHEGDRIFTRHGPRHHPGRP